MQPDLARAWLAARNFDEDRPAFMDYLADGDPMFYQPYPHRPLHEEFHDWNVHQVPACFYVERPPNAINLTWFAGRCHHCRIAMAARLVNVGHFDVQCGEDIPEMGWTAGAWVPASFYLSLVVAREDDVVLANQMPAIMEAATKNTHFGMSPRR